jgi:hypothetical protein
MWWSISRSIGTRPFASATSTDILVMSPVTPGGLGMPRVPRLTSYPDTWISLDQQVHSLGSFAAVGALVCSHPFGVSAEAPEGANASAPSATVATASAMRRPLTRPCVPGATRPFYSMRRRLWGDGPTSSRTVRHQIAATGAATTSFAALTRRSKGGAAGGR